MMVSSAIEDYLRAVMELSEHKGYARTKELAIRLKVKSPSVSDMLGRLSEKGYVKYERYGGAALTDEGRRIARKASTRNRVFARFLQMIKVPKDVAQKDAHHLEHGLDHKTVKQFAKFVEFFEKFEGRSNCLRCFDRYSQEGVEPRCTKNVEMD